MARNPYHQKNDGGWCLCPAGCGRTFTGLRAFDDHRIDITGEPGAGPEGDWRCATDAELQAKDYAPNERGRWRSTRPGAPWSREGSARTVVDTENVKRAEGAT